jgi:uncharacterized protein (TIGR02118 family)
MYPNSAGGRFDMAYYCKTHIPLAQRLLGAALKGVTVEQGIGGGTPESSAPYLAIGHLQFDSVEVFQAAFVPHGQALMNDIPNYTNVQPIIQISEVKL